MKPIGDYLLSNRNLYKWSPFKSAWIQVRANIPIPYTETLESALEWHYDGSKAAGRANRKLRRVTGKKS